MFVPNQPTSFELNLLTQLDFNLLLGNQLFCHVSKAPSQFRLIMAYLFENTYLGFLPMGLVNKPPLDLVRRSHLYISTFMDNQSLVLVFKNYF